MSDTLKSFFGSWIWYSPTPIDPTFNEYERLRFSLYFFNMILVIGLTAFFAWGLRRDRVRKSLDPFFARERIIPILFMGLFLWVAQYLFRLCTFEPGPHAFFPKDLSNYPFAKYGIPLLSASVTICFFFAGSYLLQLGERRFHSALRTTAKGVSLPRLRWVLGNRFARAALALMAAIAVCLQLGPSLSHPYGEWLDDLTGSAGFVTFGLGLLRELNRERREFVGLASAWSMIFYGLVQLGAIWPQFFFEYYLLAIPLKIALFLTMYSFGELIEQTVHARREGLESALDLLIAVKSDLRHEILDPFNDVRGIVLKLAQRVRGQERVELEEHISRALLSIKAFFDSWEEGLTKTPVNLQELLTHLKVNQLRSSDGHYVVMAPMFFLTCAISRLRENAYKFGARDITAELSGDLNSVSLRIANDGDAIPPDLPLFKRPHGTWIAEYLLELLDGRLALESRDPPVFRLELNRHDW